MALRDRQGWAALRPCLGAALLLAGALRGASQAAPSIAGLPPRVPQPGAAVFRANLEDDNELPTAVRLHWGGTDAATNAQGWAFTTNFGPRAEGAVEVPIAGLDPDAVCYHRFSASNSTGMAWTGDSRPLTPGEPLTLPGCALWYRADAGALTNATGVWRWLDVSGQGRAAVGSIGVPAWSAGALNGRPAVVFDGGDSLLAAFNPQVAPLTILGIARAAPDATATNNPSLSAWIGGGASGVCVGANRTGALPPYQSFWIAGPDATPVLWRTYGQAGSFDTQWHTHAAVLSGPRPLDWLWELDGAARGQPEMNRTQSATSFREGLSIGAAEGAGRFWRGEVAEIIVFTNVLTRLQRQQVGWHLAQKYGLATAYADPRLPVVRVEAASAVGLTSATLNGVLVTNGAAPAGVSVFWGTSEGGADPDAWTGRAELGGPFADGSLLSTNIGGLASGALHWYRFAASNLHGTAWSSSAAAFATDGAPIVRTLPPYGVSITGAVCRGELISDGGAATTLTLYWGASDGGTNASGPGGWEHGAAAGSQTEGAFSRALGGLARGTRYYVRFRAANGYGSAWSPESASFITPRLEPREFAGCELWVDASDAATVLTNAAGEVRVWLDKSGYRRNFGRALGDSPGLPSPAPGPNGTTAVRFESASRDYLVLTNMSFSSSTLPNGHTVISVARHAGTLGTNGRVIAANPKGVFPEPVTLSSWAFGFGDAGDEYWNAGPHPSAVFPSPYNNSGEWLISRAGAANTAWHLHAGKVDAAGNPSADFWKDGRLLKTGSQGSHSTGHKPGQIGLGGRKWTAPAGPYYDYSDCEVAELILYSRRLSDAELNEIGFYLAQKYGQPWVFTAPPLPVVRAEAATAVTESSAALNGRLESEGLPPLTSFVRVHWGTADGGTNGAAWQHSRDLGLAVTGAVSAVVTGLTADANYYCRFSASNALGRTWSAGARRFVTSPAWLPGMVCWLRGDRGVNVKSANRVWLWQDQSETLSRAVQSQVLYNGTDCRPVYRAAPELGGRYYVSFTAGAFLFCDPDPFEFQTTFIVYRDASTVAYTSPLGAWDMRMSFTDTNGNPFTGSAFFGAAAKGALFDGGYTTAATRNGQHYRNGEPADWASTPRPSQWAIDAHVATAPFVHGLRTVGSNDINDDTNSLPTKIAQAMSGGIAELLMYNRALSAAERDRVGTYLMLKYNIETAYPDPRPKPLRIFVR